MPRWDCRISGFNLEFPILELDCACVTSRSYRRWPVQLGLSMLTSKTIIAPIAGLVGSIFEDAVSWARELVNGRSVTMWSFNLFFISMAVTAKPGTRND